VLLKNKKTQEKMNHAIDNLLIAKIINKNKRKEK
jgi:hypothetical protein